MVVLDHALRDVSNTKENIATFHMNIELSIQNYYLFCKLTLK